MVPFIDEIGDPRRLLHAGRRRRRLAPGRDAHAPEGPGDGRADDRRRRRGHRHRRRGRPRPRASTPTRATIEADVVVIACGVWSPRIAEMAGASIPLTPAVHQMIDIGPVPMFAQRHRRGRLPDRPRHGHEHVRAPARERLRGRLVRPPGDPHGRRRHPLDRGVRPLADDAAVHPGGLRPAARGRARAVPGDRRRRVGRGEARDQRPAVADARRQPDHRRDARGQGPLVAPPRSGSRRRPGSRRRSPSG